MGFNVLAAKMMSSQEQLKITLIMSVPFIKPINHLLNSHARRKKRKKKKDNKLQSSD